MSQRQSYTSVALEQAARPLLQLVQHLTGLDTTFLTRIDWKALTQQVVLVEGQHSVPLQEGAVVNWSDSMCRLLFDTKLEQSDAIPELFPGSAGAALGMQSFFALPVLSEGKTLGTLCGASTEPMVITDTTFTSLKLIANALAYQMALDQQMQLQQRKVKVAEKTIDKLYQQAQQMENLAHTDELTGLDNRRAFQTKFEQYQLQSETQGAPLALMMIDIDEFKQLNDQHGHETGDQALQHLAKVLAAVARQSDIACRLGGDEFVLAAGNTDAQGLLHLAERVQQQFKQQMQQSGLESSLSIGIASSVESPLEQLLQRADQALYKAKESGRNRVEIAG
ncbi:MAG: sensor domain-containing diguanylate cyclase [Gammaproteobacteria bacterium]|nr:sensor domain-containing diguanylate cyclase [Gammaproteobacteria bacterium]MBU2056393.1 sensor domain-containing diguanylate cyclase [Gammaproteobacteria bacterium]MBU2177286.1 sensor domain-containing diguanylate cyclase [Gammaproteobacteria bacterium]MBU2246188.1 sensor domain-containing diguanylate cyclase [Gammaproteobacteria bacterium]MBU2343036.1 sensor domain-containing diguanylate cyclase [Gammaproteobacteria bacterium]